MNTDYAIKKLEKQKQEIEQQINKLRQENV